MSGLLGPGGRGCDSRPPRRRRRPRAFVSALVTVALLAGGAAMVTLSNGPAARSMPLDDGAAWLVSSKVGQAALVDGASAQAITQVPVGEGDLSAAQSGLSVFVANSTTGDVVRVDGATYKPSEKMRFADQGQRISVFPGASAVYAVNETVGKVTVADPTTLRPAGTQALSERVRPGGALVDADGRLWLVDGDSGDLVRLDGATRGPTSTVADPATATLVLAGGQVTLVDLAARTVRQVDGDGAHAASACLQTRQGDNTVAVTGSPTTNRVYAVSGDRGALLVSDLGRGTCGQLVDLSAARHELGPAREAGGRVFVPDITSGEVYVVDLARDTVLRARLPISAGSPFELVPGGGFMFYNDPASEHAGVVRLDGTLVEIRKYDPADPEPDGQGGGSGPSDGDSTDGPDPTPTRPPPTPTTQPETTAPPQQGRVSIVASARQAGVDDPVTLRVEVSGGGRLSQVRWTFGDEGGGAGAQNSGTEVRHAWSGTGRYTVSAKVTLADGRQAAPTIQITVTGQSPTPTVTPVPTATSTRPGGGGGEGKGDPPTARVRVTPRDGNAPLEVRVDASGSTEGSGSIVDYAIDFGDGSTGRGAETTHTYDRPGGYTVRVMVTDEAGRTGSTTQQVRVGESGPAVGLALSLVSGEHSFDAVATATSGTAPIDTYAFEVTPTPPSPPSPGRDSTVRVVNVDPGTYTVTVTVTDTAGKTATDTETIEVPAAATGPEVRDLSYRQVRNGEAELEFTATVAAGSSPIGTYRFEFSDGAVNSGNSPTVNHVLAHNGDYTVTVTVTDTAGSTGSKSFPFSLRNVCAQGFVWREARPSDLVCVGNETRDQTRYDNSQADARRAGGGEFGPDTCVQGYVWREAFDGDHVCVTGDIRDQAAYDNSQANARLL